MSDTDKLKIIVLDDNQWHIYIYILLYSLKKHNYKGTCKQGTRKPDNTIDI